MLNFKNFYQKTFLSQLNKDISYSTYFLKTDQKTIEKIFTRVFSSEDGKKAMAYLEHITFKRAHSPTIDKESLYYYEGQRALLGNILRLINHGK